MSSFALPAGVPPDWPHRHLGRIVSAGGFDWHVQLSPAPRRGAPTVVLLHGSGASAHSWSDLLPVLAREAAVVVPDLPGHAFTRPSAGAASGPLSLPRVAQALQSLLLALGPGFGGAGGGGGAGGPEGPGAGAGPLVAVGHSAGAALALRWALDAPAALQPQAIVGFAPSLVPPAAVYTQLLGPLLNPLLTSGPIAWLTAAWAGPLGLVDRLLDSTGSQLDTAQRARYAQLFRDPAHIQGVLGFMAAADLPSLLDQAVALDARCRFVLGERDAWVPPAALTAVLDRHLPRAVQLRWPEGHLLHEERPGDAAALVLSAAGSG